MKKLFLIFLVPLLLYPTTYYVSNAGSDANNGTSTATSWATLFRQYKTTFVAGDSILYKRGDTFEGAILDTLISNTIVPIVIGAYGAGAKPIFYGDLRGRTWIPVAGHSGVYKMYLGGYSELFHGYRQWVSGAWSASTLTSYRGSNSALWDQFYTDLIEGRMGMTLERDTLIVHTFGSVAIPASRDSFRVYREANRIMATSNNYIVRDLDFRSYGVGIIGYGDSGVVRNCNTLNNMTSGIRFGDNSAPLATYCLADSNRVDSTADTGMYLVLANNCVFRNNTVLNVLETIDGIDPGGIDNSGIGILGNTNALGMNGNNLVEYNTFYNIRLAFIDFYHNYRDTVRWNTGHGATTACSIGGREVVATHNKFIGNPTTGMTGGNFSTEGGWGVEFSYNTLDSISGYAFYAGANDSVGVSQIRINNNIVILRWNATYEDYGYGGSGQYQIHGIVSNYNTFYGVNGRFIYKDTLYYTPADYYTHSSYGETLGGYEHNSILNTAIITKISGDNQTKVITQALSSPYVVETRNTTGDLSVGTSVTFAISDTPATATGQVLSTYTTTTNASGQASTILTLGNKIGNYSTTATNAGLYYSPITFTSNATSAIAATISLSSGNNQSQTVYQTVTDSLIVLVVDANSNPVSGTTVTFAVTSAPPYSSAYLLSNTSGVTDSRGKIGTKLTVAQHAGAYTVTATSAGLTGSPVSITTHAYRSSNSLLIK